jgi:hypothetical protein
MFEIAGVGIVTAFIAGVISFLSPCVLPLVPGYISYVAGQTLDDVRSPDNLRGRLTALTLSAFFVLGFSTVFISLGASATALGEFLLTYKYEANIVGGIIVVLFGLFLTGLINLTWFQRDLRFHTDIKGGRPLAAYVLGLAFAFGWTPCIGPVHNNCKRRSVAQRVLTGLGSTFLARRAFYQHLHEPVAGHAQDRSPAADRRRRDLDHHGGGDDDRATIGVCLLVAQDFPQPGYYRVVQG